MLLSRCSYFETCLDRSEAGATTAEVRAPYASTRDVPLAAPGRVFGCLVVSGIAALLGACSGGSSGMSEPAPAAQPVQYGSVAVLLSSTSNDRQSQFTVTMNKLTLTNAAGHTVTVFSSPQSAEFLHLNGNLAPLLTATVPQDVYVSAAIGIANATFTCVTLESSGGLDTAEYGGANLNAVVKLPAPITVGAASTALVLSLQAAESAVFSSCANVYTSQGGVAASTALAPSFTLAPAPLAPVPSSSANGNATNLVGLVSSVDAAAGRIGMTSEDNIAWSLGTNASTVYVGVSGVSAIAAGMPIVADMAIGPDGALLATRVAVPDANPTSLSTFHGPVIFVDANAPVIYLGPLLDQGAVAAPFSYGISDGWNVNPATALYQTSSSLTNLVNLPFTASFNATTLVPGQNVLVTNHQLYFTGPNVDPAATITLLPQVIDGTVVATSTSGAFTVYTVALASYDLFPTLAVQGGQTSSLLDPATVFVYADAGTHMLNSAPIGVGSVLRFNGLVFDDNGTLRMDCADVLDGVSI